MARRGSLTRSRIRRHVSRARVDKQRHVLTTWGAAHMLARMDDVKTGEGYIPGTDMPRFIREMMEFVGLGESDVEAIRGSAPVVLRHADELTAALYEHFLKFPRSARFFLRDDGSVDTERIERRKHSLTRWLRETAEVA